MDTALPNPADFSSDGTPLDRLTYVLAPRSIVILLRSRNAGPIRHS